MKTRGKWQGMLTIARFNWPFYLLAGAIFLVALLVLVAALSGIIPHAGMILKLSAGAALAGTAYFLFGSLGVSHLVYDRSDLYRWNWLQRALRGSPENDPRCCVICHSGFDEVSAMLREKLPAASWTVLDHFDPAIMTEPSIRRARRLFPPTPGTLPANYRQWPIASESADVIFGLLAIHELRSDDERVAWFSEAHRCLRKNGRVVLVEHVRDAANFFAFGPGFLHFHSVKSWCRSWSRPGFRSYDTFSITPFVRVFVLVPS